MPILPRLQGANGPFVRVVALKPFRGQHLVDAEIKFTTGLLWKREYVQALKLLTQDGVQWHYAPGEAKQGERLRPELEDAFYRALEMYQQAEGGRSMTRPETPDGLVVDNDEPNFTVNAYGLLWSVYYFVAAKGPAKGKRGTIAFTKKPDDTWVIGLLQAGELTAEQVAAELSKGPNGDGT